MKVEISTEIEGADTLIKSAIKANYELSSVISSLMSMRQEKHRPNMGTINNFVNKLAIANNEISIVLTEANKILEVKQNV